MCNWNSHYFHKKCGGKRILPWFSRKTSVDTLTLCGCFRRIRLVCLFVSSESMAVAGCQSYDQTRGRGIVLRFNIRRWLELYQTKLQMELTMAIVMHANLCTNTRFHSLSSHNNNNNNTVQHAESDMIWNIFVFYI